MKKILKKVFSILIVINLMMGIANSAYSATVIGPVKYSNKYNLQAECVASNQVTKQVLKKYSLKRISVKDEKIKNVQKSKNSNGQIKCYAVISYDKKNISVEIPDNLFQYISSNKISKENVTITISEAEIKEIVNGNYVVSNSDAQITIYAI